MSDNTSNGSREDLQVRLVALLRELGLRPGDAVPTEAEVGRRLGISRPVVREELRALEALGVIDAPRGARRVLRGFDPEVLGRHLASTLEPTVAVIAELLELRRLLELAAFPVAAPRLTGPDIARLRELADTMAGLAARGRTFLRADQEFHAIVCGGYGNQVLDRLLAAFWLLFTAYSGEIAPSDDLTGAARIHAEIVNALEAGDFRLAAHRLETHFYDVDTRLEPLRRNSREPRPLLS